MKPTEGGRTWIKLWVNEWLEGTTRYQLTSAQRAFWTDLMAMAGRGRYGGVVCAGKDGDTYIGYPVSKYQGLMPEKFDVLKAFALFEETEKIRVEVSGESLKLYTVFILNWARYQSEYERTKKYRRKSATPESTEKLHPKSRSGYAPESDSDSESETDSETEQRTELPVTGDRPLARKDCSLGKTNPWEYSGLDRKKIDKAAMDDGFEAEFLKIFKKYQALAHGDETEDYHCYCNPADFLNEAIESLRGAGKRYPRGLLARKKQLDELARSAEAVDAGT